MARSSRIYLVEDDQRRVHAVFTVKHECATWCENQSQTRAFLDSFFIWSRLDGLYQTPRDVTRLGSVREFLTREDRNVTEIPYD